MRVQNALEVPCHTWVKRRLPLVLFVSLAVLLTGCVWSRLLTFKRQLADLNEYAKLEETDRVNLQFLDPVLMPGDLRLFEPLEPSTKSTNGNAQTWSWVFRKKQAGENTESNRFDLCFITAFKENRLEAVGFPTQFRALMPKQEMTTFLNSVGKAKVDRWNRCMTLNFSEDEAITLPSLSALQTALGIPATVSTNGGTNVLAYRYLQDTPMTATETERLAWANFSFDVRDGHLLASSGAIGTIGWQLTSLGTNSTTIHITFQNPKQESASAKD